MHNRSSFWTLILLQIIFAISFSALGHAQNQVEETKPAPAVDLLQLEEAGVKAAVKRVTTSVVQIETIGGNARDAGVSTGTVVSPEGLVLTAAYNLRHEPTSIFIKAIASGAKEPKRYIATRLATDNSRNLCLLKADLPEDVKLIPAIAASEDSLSVGATTVAIGKVHHPASASISVGIISATDRIWGRAVQTDAKISRTNYGGPLVNLNGETIGVLVPLSPDDGEIEAGAQWYDSGIGFAIPLKSYYPPIGKMAEGTDLDQGLLGVTLQGEDQYADIPEIEFCSPKSPAAECGLKAGDTIIAVDGIGVISKSQMRHVIGPKYAGDEIAITIMRGEQEKILKATLTDKIEPFVELAIGIIPERDSNETATIAQVLPNSPAAESELSKGDIISAVNTEEVKTWEDFQSSINQYEAGESIEIVVRNESESNPTPAETKTIELAPLSAELLLGDDDDAAVSEDDEPESELESISIEVAGSANQCTAFLPNAKIQKTTSVHPLFVWVAQPGSSTDFERIKDAVKEVVNRHGLVVLVPQSLNPQGWSQEEADFIVKAVGKVKKRIKIDDNRIAIGGEQTAAKMSCLTAFSHRETFRGLIMLDSLFPRRTPRIQTRPDQRLMILLAASEEFKQLDKLEKMKTVFEDRKFPVHQIQSKDKSLTTLLPQIAAWIDALDRH